LAYSGYTVATSLQAREETAGKRKANDWVITNQTTTAERATRLIWRIRTENAPEIQESILRYSYSASRLTFRLRFRESASVGAKNVLCLTLQVRIVVAGSGGSVQTVGVRRFTGMISSFLFRLSESESEPESACTIRVPLHSKPTKCTFPKLIF
jgi:hypothetical protein